MAEWLASQPGAETATSATLDSSTVAAEAEPVGYSETAEAEAEGGATAGHVAWDPQSASIGDQVNKREHVHPMVLAPPNHSCMTSSVWHRARAAHAFPRETC